MDLKEKQQELKKIAEQVAKCTRCDLFKGTTNPVPGEGSPEAKIVFIGEGPGYHEDQRGIPFCGAAGRLLDHLLELIKVSRQEVFITNVVKHRPPGNRDPMPEEIEACRSFLDEQIEIIDPEIIITLGRFSMNKFLPGEFISKIHGQARFVKFAGKKKIVIPMYHPAAALRNGKIMGEVKKDFQKVPSLLEGKGVEIEEAKENPREETNEQLCLIK